MAIRAAIESGESVEGAFSRNRSFGAKLKRYGTYIPRGQTADGPAADNTAGVQEDVRV